MRPIRPRFRTRWVVLAGVAVLAVTAPAAAQTSSSSRGGAGSSSGGSSSGGSSLGGSSLGGSTGSSSTLGFSSSTMAGSTSSLGGVTPQTGGGSGGGGFGGGTGGRGGAGGTGTIANGISSSNMLYGYYSNPLTWGLLNSRGTGTVSAPFGTALYSSLMTATTGTTGARGGAGGFGAGGTATVTSGMSLPGPQSTSRRVPTYSSTVRFRYNAPAPEQRRGDLQAILARTSSLTQSAGIQVTMDGPTVVLRGKVADDDERRLAENVLRLSPGVREIRNELEVK